MVWDATCAHRLAASYRSAATSAGAKIAELAEVRKTAKYATLSADYEFQPIAIELLGGIGPSSRRLIKKIGSLMSQQTFNCNEGMYLRQRLGIAVQIGNAACILECMNTDS